MLGSDLERGPDHPARRVRDDQIEAPEALDGGVDDTRDVLGVSEVPFDQDGAPALRLDEALRLVRRLLVADVADGDVGTLARELRRRLRGRCRARRR